MTQVPNSVRVFLEEVRFAVIATTRRDGSAHQAALWYELRGDTIVMNTGARSRKVRNLQRDPRASVTVVDSTQARHVTLEGTVAFDESHVLEDLTALASRYVSPEAGPAIAANIAKIPHVTLILSVDWLKTFGNI